MNLAGGRVASKQRASESDESYTGRTKPVTLESGAIVQAPEYLAEGETIKVDTRTGEFLGRA